MNDGLFHHEGREGHEVLEKTIWMVLRALHVLRGENWVAARQSSKAGPKSAICCLLLEMPTSEGPHGLPPALDFERGGDILPPL